jgi:uncharacterized RDD family membrane protein YckC/Tfp pilus assembly major pilin PilA
VSASLHTTDHTGDFVGTLATVSVVPLYAGFWRRAAAAILDALVLVIPDGVLQRLLNIIVACAYYASFHSSRLQATPGMKAFGIKVTDHWGGRIGLGRAIGRYFASWLSFITLGIGFLLAAFTQKRQALHDMICRTFVVNESAQPDEVVIGGGVMPVTTGVWIVAIIFTVLPAVGGFLAGILIPAYQDYTLRAKVAEIVGASGPLMEDVERAVAEKRAWTTGKVPIGSKHSSGANITPQGDVVVNLNDDIARGGRIRFTPSTTSGSVQWKCTGEDIEKKLLPAACRG